jgi:hypothetical protein
MMSLQDKFRFVDAIRKSAAGTEAKIPWTKLVDKQFRNSFHRPTQLLLWHRLKRLVPDYERKTVRDCAAWLLDKFERDESFGEAGDSDADDEEEAEFLDKQVKRRSGTTGKARVHAPVDLISDSGSSVAGAEEAGKNASKGIGGDKTGPSSSRRWKPPRAKGASAMAEPLDERDDGMGSERSIPESPRESPALSSASSIRAEDFIAPAKSSRKTSMEREASPSIGASADDGAGSEMGSSGADQQELDDADSVISSDTDMADIKSIPAR